MASDGNAGGHSPFADVLLRELRDPDKKRYVFRELLELTSEQVGKAANQRQVPAVIGTGSRPDMCLAGSGCLTTVALIAEVRQGQEVASAERDRAKGALAQVLSERSWGALSENNKDLSLLQNSRAGMLIAQPWRKMAVRRGV